MILYNEAVVKIPSVLLKKRNILLRKALYVYLKKMDITVFSFGIM